MEEKYKLDDIREIIRTSADEGYRSFQGKLMPDTKNFIGVRLPVLRKLARKIAKEEGKDYLERALARKTEEELFEEIMLQGMVIGYIKGDINDILSYTEKFLPKIDNWSVCDSFCSGWKSALDEPEKVWEWLQGFFASEEEFIVRFGVVMVVNYYVNDAYIEKLFPIFDGIRHEGYYVKMAVAWAVSICYIKYPEQCMAYLKKNRLDDFTYHKALQKITESRCVGEEEKKRIKAMRRG